jgi:hypothetical protein
MLKRDKSISHDIGRPGGSSMPPQLAGLQKKAIASVTKPG